ncbi:hypothetical protein [Neisseria sicca]|uniref:hypothetical protein n=1 Tax=Neisseria sicca TaxID=490 RepID=UPI0011BD20E3|nr:hypothetical protein [Neisseria sicca]
MGKIGRVLGEGERVREVYEKWVNGKKGVEEGEEEGERMIMEGEGLEWELKELKELDVKEGEWEGVREREERVGDCGELVEGGEEVGE